MSDETRKRIRYGRTRNLPEGYVGKPQPISNVKPPISPPPPPKKPSK